MLNARENIFPTQREGRGGSLLHNPVHLNRDDPQTLMVCSVGDLLIHTRRRTRKSHRGHCCLDVITWPPGSLPLRGATAKRKLLQTIRSSPRLHQKDLPHGSGKWLAWGLNSWNGTLFPNTEFWAGHSLAFKYLIAPRAPVKCAPNTPSAQNSELYVPQPTFSAFSLTNPLHVLCVSANLYSPIPWTHPVLFCPDALIPAAHSTCNAPSLSVKTAKSSGLNSSATRCSLPTKAVSDAQSRTPALSPPSMIGNNAVIYVSCFSSTL